MRFLCCSIFMLPIWAAGMSAYHFPSDCFFLTSLNHAGWSKRLKEKSPEFIYSIPYAMNCGSIGYGGIEVKTWPENGREFILKTLDLPEFAPRPYKPKVFRKALENSSPEIIRQVKIDNEQMNKYAEDFSDRRIVIFCSMDFDITRHKLRRRFNPDYNKEVYESMQKKAIVTPNVYAKHVKAARETAKSEISLPEGSPGSLGGVISEDGKSFVAPADFQIIVLSENWEIGPPYTGLLAHVLKSERESKYRFDGEYWQLVGGKSSDAPGSK